VSDLTIDWLGRRLCVPEKIYPANYPHGMTLREVADKLGHDEMQALITTMGNMVASLCDEKCRTNEYCANTERSMAFVGWARAMTGEYERLGMASGLKAVCT
jgi:hypothetical protein